MSSEVHKLQFVELHHFKLEEQLNRYSELQGIT